MSLWSNSNIPIPSTWTLGHFWKGYAFLHQKKKAPFLRRHGPWPQKKLLAQEWKQPQQPKLANLKVVPDWLRFTSTKLTACNPNFLFSPLQLFSLQWIYFSEQISCGAHESIATRKRKEIGVSSIPNQFHAMSFWYTICYMNSWGSHAIVLAHLDCSNPSTFGTFCLHPTCYQRPRYTMLIKSQVEKTTWQQPHSKKVFASHLVFRFFRFLRFRSVMLLPKLSDQSGQRILQASIIAIILFEIRSLRTDVMQRMGT